MLEFISNHWGSMLIAWFAVSCLVSPFIGRYIGGRVEAETRPLYPEVERKQERRISLDDPDWKDQIESIYHDHGGEG